MLIDRFGRRLRKSYREKRKLLLQTLKWTAVSSDKQCIANAFNKFFASAASKLMATLRKTCGYKQRDSDTPARQYPPFNFLEISEEFVMSQLRSLKSGKAVGLDRIPARLLKDSADIVAKPVAFIINTSLRTAQVPSDWKSARVIPLFKKGKADEMDNYRPISILPVLSKVLERAVHIQLYKYLQQNKILSTYQCGFRKCHSTEFAVLSFSDNIRRNMDQGQLTGAVFIDLRKAFDTVDHAVLLDKLSNLGILDKEHGWFTDYLSNRTQVVEFQGVTSASEDVSTGVPQGSILGPLLFILHINDLPEVVSDCNILMYADDTVLYCSSSQASVIQDKLNAELSKIDHWLSFNSLFVNVTKTEAMLFGTAPRLSAVNSFSITLNNNVIKRVFHFTYLGIVFDDRLIWNEQIKYLISKAGKRVGMLGRLRRSLTRA